MLCALYVSQPDLLAVRSQGYERLTVCSMGQRYLFWCNIWKFTLENLCCVIWGFLGNV